MLKSTLVPNDENFNEESKQMVILTTAEARVLFQAVNSLAIQSEMIKELLESVGIDPYLYTTDNPRTVARLNLTIGENKHAGN